MSSEIYHSLLRVSMRHERTRLPTLQTCKSAGYYNHESCQVSGPKFVHYTTCWKRESKRLGTCCCRAQNMTVRPRRLIEFGRKFLRAETSRGNFFARKLRQYICTCEIRAPAVPWFTNSKQALPISRDTQQFRLSHIQCLTRHVSSPTYHADTPTNHIRFGSVP